MKRIFITSGVAAATLVIAAALLWPREPAPLEFNDLPGIVVLSPPQPVNNIQLQDHNNKAFDNGHLKGQWDLMFFGYTHCPDVCPSTLNALAQALPDIKNHSSQHNNYYLVTLDPARDTAARLKEYVGYFSPDFIGIRGEQADIDTLASHMGIIYDFEGDTSGDDYIVNHYSALLVIDPQARVRAHILPPHTPARITAAFNRIKDYYVNK